MLARNVTVCSSMIPRLKLWLAAALVVSACVKAVPPASPTKPRELPPEALLATEVEAMADKAAQLLHQQQELIWQSWMTGKAPELEGTYRDTRALFSVESIRRIEKLRTLLLARLQCTLANDGV